MNYLIEPTCQITGLDEIYLKYLGYKTDGVFIEVGAFDGQTHSNTCTLADLGWEGLYVEPVEEYAELCKKRHQSNNVKVENTIIGDQEGWVRLAVAGELSTVIDNPQGMYKQAGLEGLYELENKNKTIDIYQFTLNQILFDNDVEPGFDLLVIDTESTEYKVLKGFDIDKYKPKMVIIEMHETSQEWNSIQSVKEENKNINDYFSNAHYLKVFSDGINTIFVRL